MRAIDSREYAELVEDEVTGRSYAMLKGLMLHFERRGYVRIPPAAERPGVTDWKAIESAESLKDAIIFELEKLGLDVVSDGRSY